MGRPSRRIERTAQLFFRSLLGPPQPPPALPSRSRSAARGVFPVRCMAH
jgi:hypothetical protein